MVGVSSMSVSQQMQMTAASNSDNGDGSVPRMQCVHAACQQQQRSAVDSDANAATGGDPATVNIQQIRLTTEQRCVLLSNVAVSNDDDDGMLQRWRRSVQYVPTTAQYACNAAAAANGARTAAQ